MRGIDVTTYRPADHQPEPEPEGPVVTDPDPDYEDWSDEDVAAEAEKVGAEHQRRQRVASSARSVTTALAAYQAAQGISDGTAWREPQGYLDAVPPGHTRVYEGDLYRVIADVPVVHSPAAAPDLWELVQENVEPVEPDPDDYPEWAPGMDVTTDDVLSHDGELWQPTQDHTTQVGWEPHDGTYLWRRVS